MKGQLAMNRDTMNEFKSILHDKWNKIQNYNTINKRIKKVFGRKPSAIWIKEFSNFLDHLPEEERRRKPLYTAVFAMVLLKRNLDEIDIVRLHLKKHRLISFLYGGLTILVKGNDSKFRFNISWSDGSFENKYEFLRRFVGEFYYWDYIEFFLVAEIIYKEESEKFQEILMSDQSKLLLLNLCSFDLPIHIPTHWIIPLMKDKQDSLRQNIGYYLLTKKLRSIIQQLIIWKPLQSGEKKTKKVELLGQIKKEILIVEDSMKQLDEQTQASLLFNYMLSETHWPRDFAKWLLNPKLRKWFMQEIQNKKVRTLKNVMVCLQIIQTRVTTSEQLHRKENLYLTLVDVITNFIRERQGVYQWTEDEEWTFEQICHRLPAISKAKLKRQLSLIKKGLWTSRIDELVRFDMYLKDKVTQTIIEGMLAQL
ncbi:hypothetical protein K0T92_18365 [Paenibacillus oenotherae]|uniref:Uncharacterized protein n=1 Tax=Paenibacillus oenotherae TaxID=1435645 RepID=A0ABS7D9Y1_9BACL|nr:hypothetical protein [Paenibacillus oenotherae]MBW7476686.1 hypothetical protein [Paenibacillus oenotherae]